MNRQQAYKLLGIASKHFADDDEYRAFLKRFGATAKDGRISASTMSLAQLMQACHQCKQMKMVGFVPKQKKKPANKPQVQKCYALWCELHSKGAVSDKRWAAMESWGLKYLEPISEFRYKTLNEADAYELNQCIEGLKQWLARL